MSEIVYEAGCAVVRPGRDIVASAAEDLRAELKKVMAQGPGALTVDLAGVGMIDSVGLGLLVAAHNTLGKSGEKLRIRNTGSDILGLFRTMRLDRHFVLEG
ncbi:STAS domain-containing protein [Desulfolutivibrio sulfoxidireducens]|uniref:STAS domain-containing protein n=1 Tax=Desulfolutivibrio sulfoxidireducens TaxID=2773299 RepID=UPI00159E0DB5|nr:STAS domain-containing protein [Desulfolutivibrio sulfoxidireducens]QLA17846.1 STAS domain-containing protein [Desulfolutivibrio sulfoxidireducens]QLA21426.1 STAS domain-containing protein [Desulfolutivibrio sulfoxidireducens]